MLRCNKNLNSKNITHCLPNDYYESGTKTLLTYGCRWGSILRESERFAQGHVLLNNRAWSQSPGPHSSTSHCLFMSWCLYCVHRCFSNVMWIYSTWKSCKMWILIQYFCDETWGSLFLQDFQMMPMHQVITLADLAWHWWHSKQGSLNVLQEVFTLPNVKCYIQNHSCTCICAFSEQRIWICSSHFSWSHEPK